MTRAQKLISAFVIVVIALQLGTFVYGSELWPFMMYRMYAESHQGPGVTAADRWIKAILADGTEVNVDAETAGLTYFSYRERFLQPLDANWVDKSRGEIDKQALAEEVARRAAQHLGQPVKKIILLKRRVEISGGPMLDQITPTEYVIAGPDRGDAP